MTHAEQMMVAVKRLVEVEGQRVFTRDEVRQVAEISREEWMSGYTAIFQAMRSDHPGGAPPIGARFQGVFKRVARGKYVLTEYGRQLLTEL